MTTPAYTMEEAAETDVAETFREIADWHRRNQPAPEKPKAVRSSVRLPPIPRWARTNEPVVYIIRCGEFVKIGIAANLKARLRGLVGSNPYKLSILAIFPGGGREIEQELHRKFAAHRHNGEWFHYTKEIRLWVKLGCRI